MPGVHHGYCMRDVVLTLMVIGYYHINTQTFGVSRLFHGGNAAVHGDDERYSFRPQNVHRFPVQTVALFKPVGYVGDYGSSLAP
ncbi:hypothetical protein SDC9_131917 [bioreactor metagenome]|uniref:Uncharacterized protein n=1 Tax=bioreactor metagenome TaxID=1076179 RepID=A0A645D6F5_9ZZZZ